MKNKTIYLLSIVLILVMNSCGGELNEKELEIVEKSLIGKWRGDGDEKFLMGAYIWEDYSLDIKKENGKLIYDWVRKISNAGQISNLRSRGIIELKKGKDWNDNPALNITFINSDGEDWTDWDWTITSKDSLFNNIKQVVDQENRLKSANLKSKVHWKRFYFTKLMREESGKNTDVRHRNSYVKVNEEFTKLSIQRKYSLYKTKEKNGKPDGIEIFSKWYGLDKDLYNTKWNQLVKNNWKIYDTNNPNWENELNLEVSFDFIEDWSKNNPEKINRFLKIMKDGPDSGNYGSISIPIPQTHFLSQIINKRENLDSKTPRKVYLDINQYQTYNAWGLRNDVRCGMEINIDGSEEPIDFYRIKLKDDFEENLNGVSMNSLVIGDSWSYLMFTPVIKKIKGNKSLTEEHKESTDQLENFVDTSQSINSSSPKLSKSELTGLVKGYKINLRSSPSTESKENIIGELNKDYKVYVLDKKVVGTNEDFRITNVKTIFKPFNGGSSYYIEKGVSVKYLSEDLEKNIVLFNTNKGYVNKNDLKSMEGVSWYKIRYNEKVGWVYSEFIKTNYKEVKVN